jgi:hypothetical protein
MLIKNVFLAQMDAQYVRMGPNAHYATGVIIYIKEIA